MKIILNQPMTWKRFGRLTFTRRLAAGIVSYDSHRICRMCLVFKLEQLYRAQFLFSFSSFVERAAEAFVQNVHEINSLKTCSSAMRSEWGSLLMDNQ